MSIETRRPPVDDGLFIVGLVGRTGSGKSTVARALAGRGAVVIEGDAVGHEVTDRDSEVRAALVAEYGGEIYRPDGTLDRAKVASRVFRDSAARARLDRLVHPRLLERIRSRLERLRIEGFHGPVVIDAALLLEWGLERDCDAVIAVVAPEEAQVRRLVDDRGWTAEDVRRRLSVQRTNEEFAAAADATLENLGTRTALEQSAHQTLERLAARHAARLAARKGSC